MKRLSLMLKTTILVTACFSACMYTACRKPKPPIVNCYDQQLADKYKDAMCTMDCPGVKGCDGKTYCNECIANSQGIRIVP